jgi:hypothetical protein
MALLVPITVTAATPLCLLKLVATFLRLAALLTMAVDSLSEIFLGVVDALIALAIVITRPHARHAAHQQQYSQDGNEQTFLPTIYLMRHGFLLINDVFPACSTFIGIYILGLLSG